MKQKFIGSLCILSASFLAACSQETPHSDVKKLTIDEAIKDSVFIGPCSAGQACKENEVVFLYGEGATQKPFQALYRGTGHIIFDGTTYQFVQADKKTEIGKSDANGVTLCNGAYENICNVNLTVKYPDERAPRNAKPVYLAEFSLVPAVVVEAAPQNVKKTLFKYVIPAPNQEDAGSCHYMASTGAMEILLNQWKEGQGETIDLTLNGSSDLSESWLMNIPAANNDRLTGLQKILGFNNSKNRGVLNADHPFANSFNGGKARDNWEAEYSGTADVVLPNVTIENIYGKQSISDNSKWDVALFADKEINAIKAELRKDRPVVVTYNHFGYWHVVVIVGFSDTQKQDCGWVTQFMDDKEATYKGYQEKVKVAFEKNGGCKQDGVFYVRDSLGYAGSSNDRAVKYSPRSYEWIRYLGNHAYSVRSGI